MKLSICLILACAGLNAQVADLSSSAISEGVEQLNGRRAHMTGEIRLMAGGRVAGPAVTIRLVRDENASAVEAGLTAIKLMEGAVAGSVVVAVLDGPKEFAVFGSTFAALAKARKLGGFVVDGSVRDLTDLRRFALPIFARGTASGSAGGHYRIEGTNVPVQCGGIEVRPDDWVVGDEDGVAVAPKEQMADVVAAAKRWQSEKAGILPLIEKYGSYLKALQVQKAGQ
jgi:regulator of RNase E activity RraA